MDLDRQQAQKVLKLAHEVKGALVLDPALATSKTVQMATYKLSTIVKFLREAARLLPEGDDS